MTTEQQMRALNILHSMALERTGWRGFFRRWHISDEPLRNDAANLIREIGFETLTPNHCRLVGHPPMTDKITVTQAALERVKREARNEGLKAAAKRIDAFLRVARIGATEYVKGQDECAMYLRNAILALMEDTDDE